MQGRFHRVVLACASVLACSIAWAFPPAIVPDNGSGTAHTPIMATYTGESAMQIIDGLPAGTTIDIPFPELLVPVQAGYEEPGGSLGGTKGAGIGSMFKWQMQGTGALAAFNQLVTFPIPLPAGGVASFPPPGALVPVAGTTTEVHTAPRTPYAPVQLFDTKMFRLFMQTTTEPNFDLLRVTGGTDFGMPSPGKTKLTDLGGGNWQVDSFFDITYRIDFIGSPAGPLGGMSGSTTGTVRISIGNVPEPASMAMLIPLATLLRRRRSA